MCVKRSVSAVEGSSAYEVSLPSVEAKLRMSRSFGDFYLKQNESLAAADQAICAVPDICVRQRGSEYVIYIEFLFIGFLSNELLMLLQ